MIKIKTYKLGARGAMGSIISLPPVWIRDLGLKPGEYLDVYRDARDWLIIKPPKRITGGAGL